MTEIIPLSLRHAEEMFVERFQHWDSLDALVTGLGCSEADALVELIASLGHADIAQAALTLHAQHDDDPDDWHYVDDDGVGQEWDEDALRCQECGQRKDAKQVHGAIFCPSCLHDAERSGWTGQED